MRDSNKLNRRKFLKSSGAGLTGARYDRRTRWPVRFDPRRHELNPVER